MRLTADIEIDEILPHHQFGFRHHHSTSEQIHRISETTLEEKSMFWCVPGCQTSIRQSMASRTSL